MMVTRGRVKYVIVAALLAIWCVAMGRRCSRDPDPMSPTVVASVPRVAPSAPPDASVTDAPGVDAAVAIAPGEPPPDPVRDRVWAASFLMSPDAKQLLVPVTDDDGARGTPNLHFEIWNRRGKVVRSQVVQTIDQFTYDQPSSPEVRAQELRAAALLDELAAAGWTSPPFADAKVPETSQAHGGYDNLSLELRAEGEATPSVAIELTDRELAVTPRGHAPIRQRGEGLAIVPSPAQQRRIDRAFAAGKDSGDACFNATYLRGAKIDLAHHLALVDVAYQGNDTCWEPSGGYLLFAW